MPSWFVDRLDFNPVATFVTKTVAPGTTEPDWSVILPLIEPRVSCANATDTQSKRASSKASFVFIGIQKPLEVSAGRLRPFRTPKSWSRPDGTMWHRDWE